MGVWIFSYCGERAVGDSTLGHSRYSGLRVDPVASYASRLSLAAVDSHRFTVAVAIRYLVFCFCIYLLM